MTGRQIVRDEVEPVWLARVTPADVWCERFGGGAGGSFFTIRNPGAARTVQLKLDGYPLGAAAPVFTAVTGCKVLSAQRGVLKVSIPAQWTAVVALNRPDAADLAAASRQALALFGK